MIPSLRSSSILDRFFPPRRTSSKKRDSDGLSASSGASKGSENKSRASTFSLSHLLPSRRRSKSRLSLDSDPYRSDSGACGISPPHSSSNVTRSSPTPPPTSYYQSAFVSYHGSLRGQGESHNSLDGIPLEKIVFEEGPSEFSMKECGLSINSDEKSLIMLECPVCLVEKSKDNFLEISTCHHRCCSACLKEYFRVSRPILFIHSFLSF